MTRPHLRQRHRPARGVPAGVTLASLLPLALLAGGCAGDEDDEIDLVVGVTASAA